MIKINYKNNNFVRFLYLDKKNYLSLVKIQKKKNIDKNKIIKFIKNFTFNCKKKLISNNKITALIVCLYPKGKKKCDLNAKFINLIIEIMSDLVGDTLSQNSDKEKIIKVYDRSRKISMHKGARYHQTREGGSIHTDNVNIKKSWDYLMFGCLASARAGGETILVDGNKVCNELKSKFKLAKNILERNFFWEKRGVSKGFYTAPILTYDKYKKPLFRYLRPYLESAYLRKNIKLSLKQLYALDVLDALLETSNLQFRYKMNKGDILFNLDSKVFHGRTSFSDAIDTVPIDEIGNNDSKLKRTMIRVWIKEKKN